MAYKVVAGACPYPPRRTILKHEQIVANNYFSDEDAASLVKRGFIVEVDNSLLPAAEPLAPLPPPEVEVEVITPEPAAEETPTENEPEAPKVNVPRPTGKKK